MDEDQRAQSARPFLSRPASARRCSADRHVSTSMLTTGTTYANLSRTQVSITDSFVAGTSKVSQVTGATTVVCNLTALFPAGTGTCKLKVTYSGSNAYLGVDMLIATKKATALPVGDPTSNGEGPLRQYGHRPPTQARRQQRHDLLRDSGVHRGRDQVQDIRRYGQDNHNGRVSVHIHRLHVFTR